MATWQILAGWVVLISLVLVGLNVSEANRVISEALDEDERR